MVVPEAEHSIVTDYYDERGIDIGRDRLYVTYQLGGPSELRAFTTSGKPAVTPQLPPVSSVDRPSLTEDGVLVRAGGYTSPPVLYRFDARTGEARPGRGDVAAPAGQPGRLRGPPRARDVEGRHQDPDEHRVAPRRAARRLGPVRGHRLRRLRRQPGAGLRGDLRAAPAPRGLLRRHQPARRRRVRRGVAPRRQAGAQAERVRRLRGGARRARRAQVHAAATGSASSAAPTAGC